MKELKQIGCVHFYVPDNATEMFALIEDICKGLGQYVSAVRCENDYGDIEFKYTFATSHYSVKCGFNKHHILLLDKYHPSSHVKFSGVPFIDSQRYNDSLYEEQQISVLFNKVYRNIQNAFIKVNSKK